MSFRRIKLSIYEVVTPTEEEVELKRHTWSDKSHTMKQFWTIRPSLYIGLISWRYSLGEFLCRFGLNDEQSNLSAFDITPVIEPVPTLLKEPSRFRNYTTEHSEIRHFALSWKVAGSISIAFIGKFCRRNPSGHTTFSGLTENES
jgi:hypothetical protein